MIEQHKWAFFSFKGRMRRKDYWLYSVPVMLTVVPTLFYQGGSTLLDILTLAISLFAIYASVALNMKRLQDRDRPRWWILFTLLPVVGSIYALIDLGMLDGTKGTNRYGNDPKGRVQTAFAAKDHSNNDKGTFEG